MSNHRKKHPHPRLLPPRTLWKRWYSSGAWHKQSVTLQENDEGKVVNGRVYSYHPTKGWRSRSVGGQAA
jgi:hypothetical protein